MLHLQVTGDGHQGISPSGVGRSAIGYRLRVPATSHPPSCTCFAACQRASMSPRGSAAHASQQFTMPAVPHFAIRQPLTANLKIPSRQRLRAGIAFTRGDDVRVEFRGEFEAG